MNFRVRHIHRIAVLLSLLFLILPTKLADVSNSADDTSKNYFIDSLHLESSNYKNNYNGEMSEAIFFEIIGHAQSVYDEMILENNLKPLKITGHWDSGVVNAYMKEQLQINLVDISGALARHEKITPPGFALVLCHEIGHAYGGKPEKRAPLFLASVEGQADYYATKDCLEKVLDVVPESNKVSTTQFMSEACQSSPDQNLCVRILKAGQSAANLLASLKGQGEPNYSTPDQTKVRRTLKSYPETVQCRLDTYLNGAINADRPRCWYRP